MNQNLSVALIPAQSSSTCPQFLQSTVTMTIHAPAVCSKHCSFLSLRTVILNSTLSQRPVQTSFSRAKQRILVIVSREVLRNVS